jgi:small-conductance mechanosensitive channel
MQKLITLLAGVALTLTFFILDITFQHHLLTKLYLTCLAFTGTYLIFKAIVEPLGEQRITDKKLKYNFTKVNSFLFVASFLLLSLAIWIPSRENLLISYGLIGAGLAVGFQDVVKNLVGSIVNFITGTYRVGDRIEVDGRHGDVIDINLFQTNMLEIQGWIDNDLPTGRITTIPNSVVLTKTVQNYTRDHNYLWDEITIPVTYDSDWRRAKEIAEDLVKEATAEVSFDAANNVKSLSGKYYVQEQSVTPKAYVTFNDNWVELTVRYTTKARKRRVTSNDLSQQLLDALDVDDVEIASETFDVSVEDQAHRG